MKIILAISTLVLFSLQPAFAGRGHDHKGGHGHHHGKKGKGPCAQFNCMDKAKGERPTCRTQRKACHQKQFADKLANWKSKGIKAQKKEKVLTHLKERRDHKKAKIEGMTEMVKLLDGQISEVESLPTKQ